MTNQMTRSDLESAYLATVPEIHRESSRKLLASFSDSYLLDRLAPPAKASKRAPRMARHCNDEGAS